MKVHVGFYILRPVAALICLEDSFHLGLWWEALESEGVSVH